MKRGLVARIMMAVIERYRTVSESAPLPIDQVRSWLARILPRAGRLDRSSTFFTRTLALCAEVESPVCKFGLPRAPSPPDVCALIRRGWWNGKIMNLGDMRQHEQVATLLFKVSLGRLVLVGGNMQFRSPFLSEVND